VDRRLTVFPCAGEWLGGTLDAAPGGTGLLIVSGGSEVRIGAHRGMALLAARLARAGVPVFRYDRRGIGDSSGTDPGFAAAGPDLRAAVTAFRAGQPQLRRLVALGNCDAAALLALEGRAAGLDAVILTNPWTGAEADALPPAAAIRARYRARLRDPAQWRRLVTGGVDVRRLAAGMRKLARGSPRPEPAARILAAIGAWGDDATVILAAGDATAIAYAHAAHGLATRTVTIDSASHSFARATDAEALAQAVARALAIPPLP
jgi:exosortase A-associated hydrolase 1